jgi:hypothetical protein
VGASYEAVVLAADQTALLRQLENLTEAFALMSFEAYRVGDLGFVVFGWREGIRHLGATAEIEELANALSLDFEKAVAVHFDEMLQVRDATLYHRGEMIRCFGEEAELWAPMDANGDALPDALRCPATAVPDGEEYAFVWDGIDAGLEAAGFRSWLSTSAGLWPGHVARRDDLIWKRSSAEE